MTITSPTIIDDRINNFIWNAMGNKSSCQVQGFVIFFGSIAAPLYNFSLCFYYLIVVNCNKVINADTYIKGKIENFLYAAPIVPYLVGSNMILFFDAFNPNIAYFFIRADPLCDSYNECRSTNSAA